MVTSEEQLEILKQKVKIVFADVPYPKGIIAPHECDECQEVRRTFKNKNWKTIEPEILEENFGIIPLFSSEAFHFFLPAYLIYSLEHFSEKYDTVCEYTIYAVTPDKKSIKNTSNYWQEKFKEFTLEQMNCIYEFLDLVREDENFERFIKEVETGKQNLKEFIEPLLKKYESDCGYTEKRKKRSSG
jgi:hypothetical protein